MATTLLKTKHFRVERFKFTRKGRSIEFHRIVISKTTIVIPLLDDGRIIMERQYRPVIGKHMYELPAGHVEKGEAPTSAAERELEEEIGYKAGALELMFSAYVAPGSSTERMFYYVATKLKKTHTRLEPDEFIEHEAMRFEKALSMVKDGRIIDTKTITALLYYKSFFSGK